MTIHDNPHGEPLPTPFGSLDALRDAMLTMQPFEPQLVALGSPSQQAELRLIAQGLDAIQHGQLFLSNHVDVGTGFVKAARGAARAFVAGAIGLPYEVFCAIIRLVADDLSYVALIVAKETAHLVDDDGDDLGRGWLVHTTLPVRWPGRSDGVLFLPLAEMTRIARIDGELGVKPVERSTDPFAEQRTDYQLRMLFLMLAQVADVNVAVHRNAAQHRRGKPTIPASWTIGPAARAPGANPYYDRDRTFFARAATTSTDRSAR